MARLHLHVGKTLVLASPETVEQRTGVNGDLTDQVLDSTLGFVLGTLLMILMNIDVPINYYLNNYNVMRSKCC